MTSDSKPKSLHIQAVDKCFHILVDPAMCGGGFATLPGLKSSRHLIAGGPMHLARIVRDLFRGEVGPDGESRMAGEDSRVPGEDRSDLAMRIGQLEARIGTVTRASIGEYLDSLEHRVRMLEYTAKADRFATGGVVRTDDGRTVRAETAAPPRTPGTGRHRDDVAPSPVGFETYMRALRATPSDWSETPRDPRTIPGWINLELLGLVEAFGVKYQVNFQWRRTPEGNRFLAGIDAAFPRPERAAGATIAGTAVAESATDERNGGER
jgi:hypothetical protein